MFSTYHGSAKKRDKDQVWKVAFTPWFLVDRHYGTAHASSEIITKADMKETFSDPS